MLNQSTINGTRVIEGAVIATVNVPVVAGIRFDRADSQQPKHLGKRLQERRLPALPSRHASAAASYSATARVCAAWRMRMPAGRPSLPGATPADLPASAWATLVLSRAV